MFKAPKWSYGFRSVPGMQEFATTVAIACALAFTMFSGAAQAKDVTGKWQGTLHKGQDLRVVLTIERNNANKLAAELYWPDDHTFRADTTLPIPVLSIAHEGSSFKIAIDSLHSYAGTISADGNVITGTWTQSGGQLPLNFQRATGKAVWVLDRSLHKIHFVTVDKNVRLEVLDWGGNGRPLVFLPGSGDTAHVFDKFALNFTANHHVYAITPRGFGASSWPAPTTENYAPDRLGDDVLAVMAALKIDRPVIAGHSIAGEELSSIGSRYPEKVSGLVYLDAGNAYALYNPAGDGSLIVDANEVRQKLDELMYDRSLPSGVFDLAEALPQFERDVARMQQIFAAAGAVPPKPGTVTAFVPTRLDEVRAAMNRGERRYTIIKSPLLAIFAMPPKGAPEGTYAIIEQQIGAFTAQPNARVVRLVNAQHYVYLSNEADVSREMNAFMDGLPTY